MGCISQAYTLKRPNLGRFFVGRRRTGMVLWKRYLRQDLPFLTKQADKKRPGSMEQMQRGPKRPGKYLATEDQFGAQPENIKKNPQNCSCSLTFAQFVFRKYSNSKCQKTSQLNLY